MLGGRHHVFSAGFVMVEDNQERASQGRLRRPVCDGESRPGLSPLTLAQGQISIFICFYLIYFV